MKPISLFIHNKLFLGGIIESGFKTASKRKILTPIPNNNDALPATSKLFVSKPPVKLNFINRSTVEPPSYGKRRNLTDSNNEDQNQNDIGSTLNKNWKLDNSTLNNCVFNITCCKCDKENHS